MRGKLLKGVLLLENDSLRLLLWGVGLLSLLLGERLGHGSIYDDLSTCGSKRERCLWGKEGGSSQAIRRGFRSEGLFFGGWLWLLVGNCGGLCVGELV